MLARAVANVESATAKATLPVESLGQTIKEFLEHPVESAGNAVKSLINELGPMGVVALAVGAAIGEAAHSIVGLVEEEGAAAKATENLALRLNLGFEEAKKLSEMANVAGVDLGVLQRVSMRLADALEDPAGGGQGFRWNWRGGFEQRRCAVAGTPEAGRYPGRDGTNQQGARDHGSRRRSVGAVTSKL